MYLTSYMGALFSTAKLQCPGLHPLSETPKVLFLRLVTRVFVQVPLRHSSKQVHTSESKQCTQ